MEYLALVDMMSEMSDEELRELLSKGQIAVSKLDSTHVNISKVLQEASERYLYITQIEAELTIFNEHSKDIYDEIEVTNQLSKAYFVHQVLECMMYNGAGYRHFIFISSEEEDGKITYIADVPVWTNGEGNLGTSYAAHMDSREIKVNAWGDNEWIQRKLNDYERVTFVSLNPVVMETLGQTGVDQVAGYICKKIGDVTIDKAGDMVSGTMTVANVLVDIQKDYANYVTIEGGINIIDLGEQVDALGIKAGIINVKGLDENSIKLVCPKYDPEELMVRVEAYNDAQLEKTDGHTITVDELKSSFEKGGELLDDYVDWYYEEGGGNAIAEYWGDLEDIKTKYNVQNPELELCNAKQMNVDQLQELIKKKNDSSHEINVEVMKGGNE